MYKKIIQTLVQIESIADVNALEVDGLKVWPLIRFRLAKKLQCGAFDSGDMVKKRVLKTFFSRVSNFVFQVFNSPRPSGRLNCADAVVLESPDFTRESLAHGDYDRHVDPFVELLEREGFSALKLGVGDGPRFRDVYPVSYLPIYWPNFRRRLLSRMMPSCISGRAFSELERVVFDVTAGKLDVSSDLLLVDLLPVTVYADVFEEAFSKIRPRSVFVSTYYSNPVAMGAILAARRLGISSVDIQHGSQGPDHEMYTHWTKLPPQGYELLPDFFWTWGAESGRNIERFRAPSYSNHVPVVGGNLWLAKWFRDEFVSPLVEGNQEFLESLGSHERVVLFAMQPVSDFFPELIVETIARSPRDWLWLLRFHPQQIGKSAEVLERLIARGICNVELDRSSVLPLYPVMRRCTHFVTLWSSAIAESAAIGLPSIIASPIGRDHYPSFLERGLAMFADSPERIIQIIQSDWRPSGDKEDSFIEVNKTVAASALNLIMGNGSKK